MSIRRSHNRLSKIVTLLSSKTRSQLRDAKFIVVFTGAGISSESGIPTFRDRFTGLWSKFDPMEVASQQAFQDNPQRVWDFHVGMLSMIRNAEPNAGHHAIVSLQSLVKHVTTITQNIDDLHNKAGSSDVIELHGNIFRLRSSTHVRGRQRISSPDCPVCIQINKKQSGLSAQPFCPTLAFGSVPQCPDCGSLFRPDVVWFDEALDPVKLEYANQCAEYCDVLLCVGSSLLVAPASRIPLIAQKNGAVVVDINPEETWLSESAQAYIQGSAAYALPELVREVWGA